MRCDYKIYDNEEREFLSISYAGLEGAEDYIADELGNDFERYTIYKKIS